MARPRVKINWDEFDKLCHMQATLEEIASWFNCSVDTIERATKREQKKGFAEYWAQKAARGKISLRRKQFELAMDGDRTMLIWLGKQYLGQSPKVTLLHKVAPGAITDQTQQPESAQGFEIDGLNEIEANLETINAEGRTLED